MIYRQSRIEQFTQAEASSQQHRQPLRTVCSLVQDCSMRIYPEVPCGLHPTPVQISPNKVNSSYWIQSFENSTKICTNGAVPGRWLVPCETCDDEHTCVWNNLEWIPFDCHYDLVSRDRLVQCFARKHLLLIGDSTNRGIMHYLLERLNGSLSEADKTHDTKHYELILTTGSNYPTISINVSMTFMYYPKFWIPLPNRPSFAQALQQLLTKIKVSNISSYSQHHQSKDLVFIVGGVQWIAKKHLKIIKEKLELYVYKDIYLFHFYCNSFHYFTIVKCTKLYKHYINSRFGLNEAKVVIKTLGSGFHQPVNGIHFMPLVR